MLRWSAICALALCSSVALPQAVQRPDEKVAQFLQLFFMTCVAHQANADALRISLGRRGLPLAAEPQAFLGDRQGTVWTVSASGGNYIVMLDERGVCSVRARLVDGAALRAAFVAEVERLAVGPRDTIVRVADKEIADGRADYVVFELRRAGTNQKLAFNLSTGMTRPEDQALATFSPVVDAIEPSPTPD